MACADGSSTGAENLQWPSKHVGVHQRRLPCATGTTFADPMLGDARATTAGPTHDYLPGDERPRGGHRQGVPGDRLSEGNARKQPDGCTAGAVELP